MHRPFFSYFSHILSFINCLVFCAFPVKGMINYNIDEHVNNKDEHINNKMVNNVNISEITPPPPHQSSIPIIKKGAYEQKEDNDYSDFNSASTIRFNIQFAQEKDITIPAIARGYEAIYNRFINGKLIFQSNQEKGMIVNTPKEFPFSQFAHTLNGEFDLNGLTVIYNAKTYNVSDYLRIKVGFRTEKENESKVTVWIVPKFMVDQSNSVFKSVSYVSDIGIFWSWGKYDLTNFAYLKNKQFDEISSETLYNLWSWSAGSAEIMAWWAGGSGGLRVSRLFSIQF